jgi:gas vesicle protein
MYHRSGTPNADGTITWNGSETAFAPVSLFGAETSCHYPSIAVDSNGYVYIAYMYYIGMNAPRVTRSGNNDGTWGATAWTYCLYGDCWNFSGVFVGQIIVPLTNGRMLAVFIDASFNMRVKLWDGTIWTDDLSGNVIADGWSFSAVPEGDDVHNWTDTSFPERSRWSHRNTVLYQSSKSLRHIPRAPKHLSQRLKTMAKKGYVTQAVCDERFQRTMDAIKNVADKADEAKQLLLDKTKELKEEIQSMKNDKKEESHAIRNCILTILSGATIAAIAYALGHIH